MDNFVYRIGFGESLEEVCNKFKCNAAIVLSENKIRADEVGEGTRLLLPQNSAKKHIVKPFETLERIAKLYNVSPEVLREKNGISEVFLGQIVYI